MAGIFWPTLFADAHRWVTKCKECTFFTGKKRWAALPLQPIQEDQPFVQWGLDFIGMINLPSSTGHKWVLTAMDYFTRWTEAVTLKESTDSVILEFLE
ncbi:hypothetical protein KI387_017100, partial [Taxus chinensis]